MSKPFIHPEILLKVKQGLSLNNSDQLDKASHDNAKDKGEQFADTLLKKLFPNREEYGSIKSHFNTEKLNSTKFFDFREQIISIHFQKKKITEEATQLLIQEKKLAEILSKTKKSLFKFFLKKKIVRLQLELQVVTEQKNKVEEVEKESYIEIKYEFEDMYLKDKYSDLCSAFTTLKNSEKIWDITTTQRNFETKAAAQTSIIRNEISFNFNNLEAIKTSEKILHFENFNGGDFYFYPNFIIYFKTKEEIAIIDYSDLYFEYSECRFLEETQNIPSDTKIVGETWYRVNKDGSRDKRFINNYKIPIVLYGSIHIKTETGVNELYYISDINKAKHFCEQLRLYQIALRTTNKINS